MHWFAALLDRFFVVAGALLLVQAPLFIQQYELQLMGHVAELEFQVDSMRLAAMESNKTLDQFIAKFIGGNDADFVRQGKIMSAMVARLQSLTEALTALEHASIITRPWVFINHLNYDIVKSTWKSFEPGLVFTYEGLAYILAGMCVGRFLFFVLSASTRRRFSTPGGG